MSSARAAMEIRYSRAAATTRILFGAGIFPHVAERLRARDGVRKIACISDDRVAALHAPALLSEIERAGLRADLVTFPAGETSKNRDEKARIEDRLLDLGYGRDSLILALGGGVTGDLAGFVAATFLRGIPFWQIPTTIVAMVDSSVGGKTAVDVPAGKNLIGAFHQPEEVYIDPALLTTLPGRELRAGLVEAVKHALIRDADLFASIEEGLDSLIDPTRDIDLALRIIRRNIEIKAEVVSQDERESGLRSILNYGHTLGHALELLSDYRMLHGEAVAAGIAFAGRLAVRLGLLAEGDADRQERILARLGVLIGTSEDPRRILDAFRLDKKARAGTPRFVLLDGIGRVAGLPENPTRAVDPAILRECLEAFVSTGGAGRGADPKESRYARATAEIREILGRGATFGEACAIAAEAIHRAMGTNLWTGFYLVDPDRSDELVLGPAQGPPACARIPFSRGVCGCAARERRTVIVPDVHRFPDHIACDPRAQSEIVVPVFSPAGDLLGVLDVDATEPGAFDEVDARVLEAIASAVGAAAGTRSR